MYKTYLVWDITFRAAELAAPVYVRARTYKEAVKKCADGPTNVKNLRAMTFDDLHFGAALIASVNWQKKYPRERNTDSTLHSRLRNKEK